MDLVDHTSHFAKLASEAGIQDSHPVRVDAALARGMLAHPQDHAELIGSVLNIGEDQTLSVQTGAENADTMVGDDPNIVRGFVFDPKQTETFRLRVESPGRVRRCAAKVLSMAGLQYYPSTTISARRAPLA